MGACSPATARRTPLLMRGVFPFLHPKTPLPTGAELLAYLRRVCLHAPPSKVLSPLFPHRPYPKLCITHISPVGLLARTALKSVLAHFSAPPPSEALHYSHISGGSACTPHPQKCSRPFFRTAPIRSPALLAYLRRVCLHAPPPSTCRQQTRAMQIPRPLARECTPARTRTR